MGEQKTGEKLTEAQANQMRPHFANFKFYLDNIDEPTAKRIRNGFKLLGSTIEPFFSNSCTHIVTTRGRNTPNTIVDNAEKWGMKIWNVDKAKGFLRFLVESKVRRRVNNHQDLRRLLEEERAQGHSGSTQQQSQFIPFKYPYFLVEEPSGKHRPIVIKEYTRAHQDLSWPVLSKTPPGKPPFSRHPSDSSSKPPQAPKTDTAKHNDEKNDVHDKENAKEVAQDHQDANQGKQVELPKEPIADQPPGKSQTPLEIHPPTPPRGKDPLPPQDTPVVYAPSPTEQPELPDTPQQSSSIRPTGFQPSLAAPSNHTTTAHTTTATTTTTTTTTTANTQPTSSNTSQRRKLPRAESVARLDRRMVDNSNTPNPVRSIAMNNAASEAASLMQREKEKEREKERLKRKERQRRDYQRRKMEQETNWCENCKARYPNYQEHIKTETHQKFIQNEDNYSELDSLLESIRRLYKEPLPEYMRQSIDPGIDGNNVAFREASKRKSISFNEDWPTKRQARG
ncbi:Dfp1/Him1, central region-domain-containing protein [Syncephalastrum racemosum]|uniref:Dfp1/Him1, central region-domain-containing protein n=1 Tax=Syncephalastrum racemosum TaxID=13706 RepID=A0A1X2HSS4_SYNRA|nr:Dfp1/Him1, central region-domain-containing protein [Syncephalastrum racemosum]